MKTKDFSFELPEALIATQPTEKRDASRLFVLDPRAPEGCGPDLRWQHKHVFELAELVPPGTVMVFNDSRVRKARLHATSRSGRKIELLLLEAQADRQHWTALAKGLGRLKEGDRLSLPDNRELSLGPREGELRHLFCEEPLEETYLEEFGHVPLPPYMKREDEPGDSQRYQTIYARNLGSAAAPTAGLHFTDELLGRLKARGVELHFVTLHVGLGTFLPVRVDDIEAHQMHREVYSVPAATAAAVNAAKASGRPVLAVGTTSLRTLESAWQEGRGLTAGDGSTDLFLRPGSRFFCVDQLFTNFHTPESTLLMLVSAFAGYDVILAAYKEAVRLGYRFFSYGDAMFIRRSQ